MSERIFRFVDPTSGAAQISRFPETPPQDDSDFKVRVRHFTEIENFGFLGYLLAHEIGEEALGDELLDVCINWEHFVASTNDKMIVGSPLKITDLKLQALIDALDEQSEVLVDLINQRARERAEEAYAQTKEAVKP